MNLKLMIICIAIVINFVVILKYTRPFGRMYFKLLQKYMDLTWGSKTFDVNKMLIPRSINELLPLPIIGLISLAFLFYALYGTVYLY